MKDFVCRLQSLLLFDAPFKNREVRESFLSIHICQQQQFPQWPLAATRKKIIVIFWGNDFLSHFGLVLLVGCLLVLRLGRNLSFAEIKTVRQQQSVPVLEALGKWMRDEYIRAIPKSSIGKALGYSIERWEKLSRYTEGGMLNIDNNPVENSIRPVALGRKNYLFAGQS